jgi:hypothetical protein
MKQLIQPYATMAALSRDPRTVSFPQPAELPVTSPNPPTSDPVPTPTDINPSKRSKASVTSMKEPAKQEMKNDGGSSVKSASVDSIALPSYNPLLHDNFTLRAEVLPLLRCFGEDETSKWVQWVRASYLVLTIGYLNPTF